MLGVLLGAGIAGAVAALARFTGSSSGNGSLFSSGTTPPQLQIQPRSSSSASRMNPPAPIVAPKAPAAASAVPARAPIHEPEPEPIEHEQPPVAPEPPPDDDEALPTPPPPQHTVPAPVVKPAAPAKAPPAAVVKPATPPAVIDHPSAEEEPQPEEHESAPPPAPAHPPPDVVSPVPTPATPKPTAPVAIDHAPPAGFDPALARTLAPKVNANLISKKIGGYDHKLLKQFQTAAGIASDGLYGGGSRGALIAYGQKNAPPAFYKPTAVTPYPWAALIPQMPAAPIKTVSPAPAAVPPGEPAPAKAAPAPAARPAAAAATPPQPAAAAPAAAHDVPPVGFDPAGARKMAKQVANNLQSKGVAGYDHALLRSFQTKAGISADGIYGGGARGALIHFGVPRPPQPFFKPTTTQPYPWAAFDTTGASS